MRDAGAPSGGCPVALPPAPRSSWSLLVDRNFGPWFWGSLVSNSGGWLFNVTAAVVVFDLTRSAFLVGLVSVAQFAPLAVLSPWAGALSDRLNRRRLLFAGQSMVVFSATGVAITALMLGIEGLPGAWPVLLGALGMGLGKAFTVPTLNSLVPALVDDVDLESAVSLNSLTFNGGRALGPAGAGVLLVTLGPEVAFLLNAVSFLGLMAAVLAVRPRPRKRTVGKDRSVRAAIHYVLHDRVILLLLAGVAAAGFASDPVITLAPPLAAVLGSQETIVAVMVSVFGITAAPAALFSGRLQRSVGSAPVARSGMLLMACGLLMGAFAQAPWMALVGFSAMGGGFVLAVTSFTSLLQRRVPDFLRGRVMALWGIAFLGNRPVAAVLHGSAADTFGPRYAMGIAIGVALGGALIAIRLHQIALQPAAT